MFTALGALGLGLRVDGSESGFGGRFVKLHSGFETQTPALWSSPSFRLQIGAPKAKQKSL